MYFKTKLILLCNMLIYCSLQMKGQVSMTDMSYWQPTGKANWQIVKEVIADLDVPETFRTEAGTGVLVNLPNKDNRANLVAAQEHGDAKISFDFMMAPHSNSGFYLQGRYEIQLLDSWGVKDPKTGDCGGIYKRRRYIKNEATGKMDEYLWEGHAPRINTCLAPGLWQHIEVDFIAPKFNSTGQKTANAKIIYLKMNGVTIHENLELTGPTGGPISETEVAMGPVMIQGDHGAVAFRNIKITSLNGTPVSVKSIDYQSFIGSFREPKDFLTTQPKFTGKLQKFTHEINNQPNDFATIYKSKIMAPTAGPYTITFQLAGKYYVSVNGKEVLPDVWTFTRDQRKVNVDLKAGENTMDITVYKTDGWMAPIMGVWVENESTRPTPLHSLGSLMAGVPSDPIYYHAHTPTLLRSFVDLYKNGEKVKRVTHAVNVGHPDKLHYTYNTATGAIVQLWKGGFLNTSPMWDNRGDGSSTPMGTVLSFDDLPLVNNGNINASFKTLGYTLDKDDLPTFMYSIDGQTINDKIRTIEGKHLSRTIDIKGEPKGNLNLAIGSTIKNTAPNMYLVDDSYFIKAEKATIETVNGKAVLRRNAESTYTYDIIW